MPAFGRTYRQKIIDEYLNATRRNAFVPAEFLHWLEPQKAHRVWLVFFGKDEAAAAHQYRLMLARQFVAGLRIVVQSQSGGEPVSVKVPAFISPVSERRTGGGYVGVDVSDRDTTAELCRQAAADMERWINRWSGAAALIGVDITEANRIAGALIARGVEAAA